MKQAALNLFFALIAFILVYGIALLTGLPVIQEAVLIAFIIQWICFIPAYFFQTEKFYDLAGSCTYLFMLRLCKLHWLFITQSQYSEHSVGLLHITLGHPIRHLLISKNSSS